MKKKFFATYWSAKYEAMANTIIELTLKRENMSQGEIAMLIDDKLDVYSRLINFWEI